MAIDYTETDRIIEISFGKLDKTSAKMDFPERGTLSKHLNSLLVDIDTTTPILAHKFIPMLASAGVEMWHRAIHSFLWSIALTEGSPLWSSVSGYYSSHFVMRALAHSMGIFKSFTKSEIIQVTADGGQFICTPISWGKNRGEHAFYWKAIKDHPKFISNTLFRENYEKDTKSDSSHRTFANYTDHINSFVPINFPSPAEVAERIEKISRIRRGSVTTPSREDYPDLQNVQILAYQRIVAFQDFMDEKINKNRFWRAHRRPSWCNYLMRYEVEDQGLEQLQT